MSQTEKAEESRNAAPAIPPALVGLLISAISGALVGACLTLIFLAPFILNR